MYLPIPLYTAKDVREFDRRAIEQHGIAGLELMTRAGTTVFRALRIRFPRARRIVVVCGSGNNGGDGYVVARLAKETGFEVSVLAIGQPRSDTDAARARAQCEAAGVKAQPFEEDALRRADVIVDALLGTGLERPVEGEWRAAIDAMSASARPIVAVDVPSGLHSDTGAVMGAAVRATITVSFIGLKVGLLTSDGRDHSGEILFDDLDMPATVYDGVVPAAHRLSASQMRGVLPRRLPNAHKGRFGHVLVIGGGSGMPGAARLCGEAALRAGAGLVTIATHPANAATLNIGRPELMVHGVRTARALAPLIERATVIALGPGLSQDAWARSMWRVALGTDLPLVVDADGLNLLALKPTKKKDWILTPHPGEAARLLKGKTPMVQQDRLAATADIVKRFDGVCVLKGAGTLIASRDATALCDRGNPGMASGGTGDVLTGLIAGLRAQGLTAFDAARLGVWVHAVAGDQAAAHGGQVGLLASDIFPFIRRELSQLSDDGSRS